MSTTSSSGPRIRLALVALAAMVAFAGCGGGGATSGGHDEHGDATDADEGDENTAPAFEEEAATTKIAVTLQDFAFVGLPGSAKGPNVLFEATVKGSNEHELVIHDAGGATVGVLQPFRSGRTKKLAAALPPGTYTVLCLVKEGQKAHADLGMRAELRVE